MDRINKKMMLDYLSVLEDILYSDGPSVESSRLYAEGCTLVQAMEAYGDITPEEREHMANLIHIFRMTKTDKN